MSNRATRRPRLPTPDSAIRDWRARAAEHAIESLLLETGCRGLTVDAIVKSLGVAKGSVYLRWPDVDRLITALLDRWTDEVQAPLDDQGESLAGAVCHTLFAPVPWGSTTRPALPCCLHASPCPHGWNDRWDRLSSRLQLGGEVIAQLIGEAVQAIAASPTVRRLLADARYEEAAAVVATVIEGAGDA